MAMNSDPIITTMDVSEFLLAKFDLKMGDIVKGYDLWNNIISKGNYSRIKRYFNFVVELIGMDDAAILSDPLTNNILGSGLGKRQIKNGKGDKTLRRNIWNDYRITNAKLHGEEVIIYGVPRAKTNNKEWAFRSIPILVYSMYRNWFGVYEDPDRKDIYGHNVLYIVIGQTRYYMDRCYDEKFDLVDDLCYINNNPEDHTYFRSYLDENRIKYETYPDDSDKTYILGRFLNKLY